MWRGLSSLSIPIKYKFCTSSKKSDYFAYLFVVISSLSGSMLIYDDDDSDVSIFLENGVS